MTNPATTHASSEFDFVDAIPAIVWRADAATLRFSSVSKAAEEILGYPVERWLDEADFWQSHIHVDDRWVIDACRTETLAGRDHELVYRMIAADGRTVWLRDKVTIRSCSGRPELFGVMMDVTEAKETAAAAAQSEDNHRRMIELLPTGIGVHVDGVLVFVNDALVRILGASGSWDLIGRRAVDFVAPAERSEVEERQGELRAGRPVPFQRRVLTGVNGQRVNVEVAAVPVMYDGKRAAQLVVRDLREKVEAEREIRSLSERLETLAAGTNEAIWEWDLTTGELWTNQAHHDLFRPSGKQARYEDWVERIHPDDRKRVVERSERARSTVASRWSDEYRFQFPDGTYGWILDRGAVVPGPDGRAQRMVGEMLDVTPMRRAEQERRSAELRLRTVLENSLLGAYVIRDGRFRYINPIGAAVFGYDVRELMAIEDIGLLFHEEERAGVRRLLDPQETRVPSRFAARCRHKSGREIVVEFSGSASSIDGRAVMTGTMLDMTEQHRIRRELEQSERQYKDLVEQLRDVVYSCDRAGRITSLNPAFEILTGFKTEDWIGKPFLDIVLPESIEGAVDRFQQTMSGSSEVVVGQYKIRSKEQGVIDIEATGHPKIVDGEIVGVVGTVRDVTMRNLLERRLEDTKRLASLGQLAASMAHEFNNVLMGIQPFIDVINRDAAALPRVGDACRHMLQSVARGKSVTQQILRYANPKPSELEPIDIREWLYDAIAQTRPAMPQGIAIREMVDLTCSRVLADRRHLDQIFVNLLYNARDAMPGGGSIAVSVTPAKRREIQQFSLDPAAEYVCVSVTDDGPGMTADVLRRIFDPLFTTKRNGTGLGLSVARKLMEAQSGAIAVESTPGKGTTFHLFLRSSAEAPKTARDDESTGHGMRRVVLVEDEPIVAMGVCAMLKDVNIATVHVAEGGAAEEAVATHQPDAVIVDVNLPDMNGLELCAALRSRWPDLPIVVATGHVEFHERDELVSLMKPYSLHELVAALQRARRARG